MEPAGEAAARYQFTTVDRGWDPDEVRRALGSLSDEVAELQRRLKTSEATATVEPGAAEIHERAVSTARRIRERAAGDAREMLVKARTDSLDIVMGAREEADTLLSKAREREAEVAERVRVLQTIVRRTEALLRVVAEGEYGGDADDESGDIDLVVAAEQSRVAGRLQAGAQPPEGSLPQSVRRLLSALKAGEIGDG